MKIVVAATEDQKREIIDYKISSERVEFYFVNHRDEIQNYEDFDSYFLLTGDIPKPNLQVFSGKPVVVNLVIDTLSSLKLPSNFCRINAWPGFLQRPVYEVAANDEKKAAPLFKALGWDILFVKDQPGLVAARVVSMIVNEAYFAVGENLSTTGEIDVAMKLATNYPMGPFEWEAQIGTKNICMLLKKLSETEKRYSLAPALAEKFKRFMPS